jgi:dTDP-glucose 4,6-dehydratase
VTYDLPVLITRCSNNYGPYQYPEKLIPLFVINAFQNKKLPVYGDGKNVRDWIYVWDHCNAIDFVIENGTLGEVYNIGGENERHNLEITEFILEKLGKGKELITFVKDRPGHDRRYSLECSKLKKLGWKAEYDLKEALGKTIDWYIENQNWWQKILNKDYKEYYEKQYGKND